MCTLCIQLFNSGVSYYHDHSNIPSYPINGKPNALSDRDRNTLTCNDVAGELDHLLFTLKNELGDHKKHPKRDGHVSIWPHCLLMARLSSTIYKNKVDLVMLPSPL